MYIRATYVGKCGPLWRRRGEDYPPPPAFKVGVLVVQFRIFHLSRRGGCAAGIYLGELTLLPHKCATAAAAAYRHAGNMLPFVLTQTPSGSLYIPRTVPLSVPNLSVCINYNTESNTRGHRLNQRT